MCKLELKIQIGVDSFIKSHYIQLKTQKRNILYSDRLWLDQKKWREIQIYQVGSIHGSGVFLRTTHVTQAKAQKKLMSKMCSQYS